MGEQKQSKNNSNELIIQHFILAISILFQSLLKVLNIIIPNPKFRQSVGNKSSNKGSIEEMKNQSSTLLETSNDQLRQILSDVDVISHLEKSQLTELILSSEEAMELIKLEKRRNTLKKLTNQDIKVLLQGTEGISRLRKHELIEMVIRQENPHKKLNKKQKK